MPTIAITRSGEKHRSFKRLYSMVEEAMEHLGGFDAFVKPGQTVLIKPDQSVPRLSEGGSTTDPLLVAAIIRLAQYAGAGKIAVAASSAGYRNSLECMRATGMAAIAERFGADLLDLGSDRLPNVHIDLPEGRVLKTATVPRVLLETDVVIAVPKAKTDYLDGIGVSLEFCRGALNQVWRALQLESGDVIERLADVMMAIRPDLWITDALICGEGDGPHENVPHWCGAVIASSDPVAMDATIAKLLSHNPLRLRFAEALLHRGMGYREPIASLGAGVEGLAFGAWPAHRGVAYLPVNLIQGSGVDEAGTIGAMKAALESLIRQGILQHWMHDAGTPTILLGDADDPDFERHLAEGPYVVVDDAAQSRYRQDPRVFFIPGHPVTQRVPEELRRIIRQGRKRSARADSRPRNQARAAAVLGALAAGAMAWNRGTRKRD